MVAAQVLGDALIKPHTLALIVMPSVYTSLPSRPNCSYAYSYNSVSNTCWNNIVVHCMSLPFPVENANSPSSHDREAASQPTLSEITQGNDTAKTTSLPPLPGWLQLLSTPGEHLQTCMCLLQTETWVSPVVQHRPWSATS